MKVSRTPEPWRLITTPSYTCSPPALALDHLEVDAHRVPGLELGDPLAQLGAFELLDDLARERRAPRRRRRNRSEPLRFCGSRGRLSRSKARQVPPSARSGGSTAASRRSSCRSDLPERFRDEPRLLVLDVVPCVRDDVRGGRGRGVDARAVRGFEDRDQQRAEGDASQRGRVANVDRLGACRDDTAAPRAAPGRTVDEHQWQRLLMPRHEEKDVVAAERWPPRTYRGGTRAREQLAKVRDVDNRLRRRLGVAPETPAGSLGHTRDARELAPNRPPLRCRCRCQAPARGRSSESRCRGTRATARARRCPPSARPGSRGVSSESLRLPARSTT